MPWYKIHRPSKTERGFRSKEEEVFADWLTSQGIGYKYELERLEYTLQSHYKTDFTLDNGIIIEYKGLWEGSDRRKHLAVKKQHPDREVRFVFTNPNAKITKGSKTTYAMWCDQHGFKWSKKVMPLEWAQEKRD